ncbi:septum formation initiator family protein [Mycobacterium sp. PS03-16]|uniref:FtsB family cell division protein n=1 Tax=Mycobacterium sp. PS03-16 TaxID=2559611 RepID=UPI001073490B|nr:septum formation initiator family protein [Mycobacterium sp. PS03-16]TFV61033.1 septum formation initiator family protein [Mycobacterium sp. PS03-16]
MPESKRPDPKRRSPASRPGRPGGAGRGRPKGTSAPRREPRAIEARPAPEQEPAESESVGRAIAHRAERIAEEQSEQRFGSAARRAAILAAVVCVLTLTIAGPVRTYFAQRTEMKQLKATEEQLRAQIAELEQQKVKLADPAFIAAQARERLGFVKPGDIPYQVQLPPGAVTPGGPEAQPETAPSGDPWYTSLWHTIADEPHGISPTIAPGVPPGPPPAPGPPPPVPPPGG